MKKNKLPIICDDNLLMELLKNTNRSLTDTGKAVLYILLKYEDIFNLYIDDYENKISVCPKKDYKLKGLNNILYTDKYIYNNLNVIEEELKSNLEDIYNLLETEKTNAINNINIMLELNDDEISELYRIIYSYYYDKQNGCSGNLSKIMYNYFRYKKLLSNNNLPISLKDDIITKEKILEIVDLYEKKLEYIFSNDIFEQFKNEDINTYKEWFSNYFNNLDKFERDNFVIRHYFYNRNIGDKNSTLSEIKIKKMILYKDYYQNSTIINDSEVLYNYHKFIDEDILILDTFDYFDYDSFFIDFSNTIDIINKEYGNMIYIIRKDDYEKIKNLPTKTAIKEYIDNNLKGFASYTNHMGDFDLRVRDIVKKIKDNVKAYEIDEELKEEPAKEDLTINEKIKENKELEKIEDLLIFVNEERKRNGEELLSFTTSSFSDIYNAIYEYKSFNVLDTKNVRNPLVAKITKERATIKIDDITLYRCELCDDSSIIPVYFESHHFIPISDNGPDNIYNTVCLCNKCHTAIHNGLVTNEQKFKLLETIKNHLLNNNPEYIGLFEENLGMENNVYQKDYDILNNKIIEIQNSNIEEKEKNKIILTYQEKRDNVYNELINFKALYLQENNKEKQLIKNKN